MTSLNTRGENVLLIFVFLCHLSKSSVHKNEAHSKKTHSVEALDSFIRVCVPVGLYVSGDCTVCL